MIKVGICACYTNHNYGSMLQSYATQKAFEAEGFECEMIRYRKKKTLRFILKSIPRLLNRITIADKYLVIQKKINLCRHAEAAQENRIREAAFNRFQEKYFTNLSPVFYGYDELKKGAESYAGVISGSDQVWSPSALATHFYDLTFVPEHVIKASYASSFGVKGIPFYQLKRTKFYLKRLTGISVREIAGQKIVYDLIGQEVPVVCDPTFLFNAENWEKHIERKQLIREPYLFAYFLGAEEEHRRVVREYAKTVGLKIVAIHHMDQYVEADEGFGDIVMSDVGPEEFVNLIRGADCVCTDSFHGTIFSVLHHRPFVTFNRYSDTAKHSKNSRIDSICQILGLSERRYQGNLEHQMSQTIDYVAVDQKANEFRSASLAYIHQIANRIRSN